MVSIGHSHDTASVHPVARSVQIGVRFPGREYLFRFLLECTRSTSGCFRFFNFLISMMTLLDQSCLSRRMPIRVAQIARHFARLTRLVPTQFRTVLAYRSTVQCSTAERAGHRTMKFRHNGSQIRTSLDSRQRLRSGQITRVTGKETRTAIWALRRWNFDCRCGCQLSSGRRPTVGPTSFAVRSCWYSTESI
ncbi:hypothetical protein BCV70DRAFT_203360, partial [Testicularia cyperi]